MEGTVANDSPFRHYTFPARPTELPRLRTLCMRTDIAGAVFSDSAVPMLREPLELSVTTKSLEGTHWMSIQSMYVLYISMLLPCHVIELVGMI